MQRRIPAALAALAVTAGLAALLRDRGGDSGAAPPAPPPAPLRIEAPRDLAAEAAIARLAQRVALPVALPVAAKAREPLAAELSDGLGGEAALAARSIPVAEPPLALLALTGAGGLAGARLLRRRGLH